MRASGGSESILTISIRLNARETFYEKCLRELAMLILLNTILEDTILLIY